MELRKLGNDNIKIAPIVLGGNVFGWTIDEKQSFAILDAFIDAVLTVLILLICTQIGYQEIKAEKVRLLLVNGLLQEKTEIKSFLLQK